MRQRSDHLKEFPYNQREGGQACLKRDLGGRSHGGMGPLCLQPQKAEGDSAIPSSQRQTPMDRGLPSPECKEVVVGTSQVVVGTSQKGGEAVGYQPIRPSEEEEKEG